jgi:hypothetical protein
MKPWVNTPINDNFNFNSLSFKKRPPCQSNNGYIVYESKNGARSQKIQYFKILYTIFPCDHQV